MSTDDSNDTVVEAAAAAAAAVREDDDDDNEMPSLSILVRDDDDDAAVAAAAAAAAATTTAATATIDATDTIDTNDTIDATEAATAYKHTVVQIAAAAAAATTIDANDTIDTIDADSAAAAATAAPTKKKNKRRRSGLSSKVRGNKQKRTTQLPVQPNTKRAAASSSRRTVSKTKRNSNSNSNVVKTIKRLRISEQRLSSRLEETKEDIKEAVTEATSKAKQNITVAYEKELQKQQQEHSKIQSVTAVQTNKYKCMIDNLKDRNLNKSRTTTNTKIATLKEKHKKEVSVVKKKNTKSMNRVKSDAYHATKELERQLLALQEEQKKEEENKLEYERNKKQLERLGRQLSHLQKQKEKDTPKIKEILIQSIETHRAMRGLSKSKNLAQKKAAAVETTVEHLSSSLSSVTNKFEIATQRNVELEIENSELKLRVAQLEAATPLPVVEKESNKLISARGGQKTFPFWLIGIILEQLVNNTPPSSINSNILSVMKVVSPSTKIIELPSLGYNRRLHRKKSKF